MDNGYVYLVLKNCHRRTIGWSINVQWTDVVPESWKFLLFLMFWPAKVTRMGCFGLINATKGIPKWGQNGTFKSFWIFNRNSHVQPDKNVTLKVPLDVKGINYLFTKSPLFKIVWAWFERVFQKVIWQSHETRHGKN